MKVVSPTEQVQRSTDQDGSDTQISAAARHRQTGIEPAGVTRGTDGENGEYSVIITMNIYHS